MKKPKIGGQAVIEGVMMKTKRKLAIAVRKSNNKITIKKQNLSPISNRIKFLGWPFIRGVVELFEIIVIGIKALNYSADQSADKEEEKLSAFHLVLTIALAFLLAFALFKFLPLLLTKLIHKRGIIGDSRTIFNLIDGLIRVSIFIIYLLLISLMSDVKRLFQYHGAEHKAVHCYEAGKKLIPENVKKYSTLHPRCGPSFLVIVLFVAIIVFSSVKIDINFWLLLALRMPLILPIAGISYEILKIADRYRHNSFFRAVSWPGLLIQKITAKEPDKKQIEVAIKSLKAVLAMENKKELF